MNKEKDFFKTCFNTVAGLEVTNESQAIAKEVVLSEIENLQQENKQLKEIIKENTILVKDEYGDYQECNINPLEMKQKQDKQVANWNKLKEIIKKKFFAQGGFTCYEWNDLLNELLDKMQEMEQNYGDMGNNT